MLAGVHRLDRHLVLGQGAGFVRADHRGAAEGLDRPQPADQRMALHHPLHAQRQSDGHDRRQSFRYGGDRQAYGRQERLHQLAPAPPLQSEHHRHKHEAQVHDPFAELLEPLLERRGLLLDLLDHPGNLAELGLHAGLGHHGPGPAGGDRRAQIDHVGPVRQRRVPLIQRRRRLDYRRRFARQAGLLRAEIGRQPCHAAVGGHAVARLQLDQDRRGQVPRTRGSDVCRHG